MKHSKSSQRWLDRQHADPYVKLAKQKGYRSRAAFKLLEIADKHNILRPNQSVIDLGAAPGGWCQVIREKIGQGGKVVALDILDMPKVADVTFVQGDVREQNTMDKLLNLLENSKVDWIVSDMAPNITGIKSTDEGNYLELFELVLDLADSCLKPSGGLLIKTFHGVDFKEISRELRDRFETLRRIKPKASRDESKEVYVLATGYT